ncbi:MULTISPECIES: DUF2490 domain-containing protein [unclassified Mucilaginibacter]|uniref:DUF2490 domain-containing protein n=1 Tax=unclassified Mucilaginibacter TaxID=2617802 RepID=UPI002AC99E43|nr:MULTISPECIES: DUF2490 domain-containing protein [unclassified Mucilaginibacter]MEB0262374.1 DUF2490 domain-containing protein [Mucilaginibacter sp. 10I4]MEB0280457.1 DUF2490 domain-containing protein [Mucilaginibacter sp. 10B2]MEB0300433.1 DUF2490 domain-containing protein [Mucilaginibacter sp. 5C4]WPX23132.1 DUF2490 domain-containing protein [Mucilaginibacter sp. 5C4]
MKKALTVLLLITILIPCKLFAQDNRFSGWAALFHSQKFSDKWGMSFDAQFRSANHYDYLQNVLLRPSVNYYFDNNKMAALGYAYIATNNKVAGVETFRPESRIWEQLIINTKISKATTLQHRFRLEQRFLGNTTAKNDHYFAQRLRYFARAVVPLKKTDAFTKGMFLGLQNEIMVNVQNNQKVNKHFFDQNRAYVALGYRLHKKADIEFGYLNQFVQQASATYFNHVLQAAIYTRL